MIRNVIRLILLVIILLGAQLSYAQVAIPSLVAPKDSLEVIPLSNISPRAAEDEAKITNQLNKIISYDDIAKISHKNDTILTILQTKMLAGDSILEHTKSIRKLQNLSTSVSEGSAWMSKQRDQTKAEIVSVDAQIQQLSDLEIIWKNTIEKNPKAAKIAKERMSGIIHLIDSASTDLTLKSNKLLLEMDKSTNLLLLLKQQQVSVDRVLSKLENPFVNERANSIFSLNYANVQQWKIGDAFLDFVYVNLLDITKYFSHRISSLVFILISFVLLLFVFYKYKNHFEAYKPGFGAWYKQHLNLILVRHVSAAIIVTMFISYLILQGRPLIVRDLLSYIIIVPLLLIFKTLVDKRFHALLNLFPLFMIPYTFYIIYTPDTAVFRLALLSMPIFQLFLLVGMLKIIVKTTFQTVMQRNVVKFIIYLHIVLAGISALASVLGYVVVSQNLMLTVYNNIIYGCSLFICSVLFNGLFLNIIESKKLQGKVRSIAIFEQVLRVRFVWLINVAARISWIYLFLVSLTLHKYITQGIYNFFTHEWVIGKLPFSIWGILIFFIVIYLAKTISHVVQVVLEEDVLNKMSLSKGLPHTIGVMCRYAIIAIGVSVALGVAGFELSQFTIVLSAFGVGIGFGLQNIFNNLVSGFILLFERPIQLGDMIEVGPLLGKVKSIGIRSSNIETVDGAEVIVPNGQLVSSEVVNWTLSNRKKRIEILVGIGYDSITQDVKAMIEHILAERDDIMLDPAPIILFNNIGESSLNFRILFWTADFGQAMSLKSEVTTRIYDVLRANGVEMPFAQHDLNIRTIDDAFLDKIKKEKLL